MKAVIQRVKESSVSVEGEIIGSIKTGLLILLGIAKGDQKAEADYLSEKVANLRIFEDENGKMNRSLLETGGEALVISQFTLLGDCRKGRRPSFIAAAEPEDANLLYEYFANRLEGKGISVQTGKFRAMMDVALVNDGPVTLIVENP
ncbi:MAG: D-tyrosyl-tRNA(Tyr) deacylase [Deltaproteobacteria bacterium]|nr:D-tyrosyl-tRNA(Tyr) deacylase [Deltaproteobacteria bacterium]